MKYIKKFNESLGIESFFKPLINFDMIEDLKNLSINYLDKDWTLYIDVRCDGLNGLRNGSFLQGDIYRLVYSIDDESEWYGSIDGFKREFIQGIGKAPYDPYDEYENNGLNYAFTVAKRISHSATATRNQASINLDVSTEILESIKELHTNENINLSLSFFNGVKCDVDVKQKPTN